ncbi:MAG: CehA/McbA family metallohydrolase, partial [Clostridiales bacterium]|nr:CehA/McbA family metallohydrolase [Clostridiales bacterium]
MKRIGNRTLSVLMIFSMLAVLFPAFVLTAAPALAATGDRYPVAEWNYGGVTGTPNTLSATDGEYFLSSSVRLANGTFGWGSTGILATGWDNATQSLTFTFSTKGFSGILHSAKVRSSATGPRNFKVQYSLDGVSFTDTGGTFTSYSTSSVDGPVDMPLPAACNDKDQIWVRWVLVNFTQQNGSTGAGGSFNFNAVKFSGVATDESLTPFVIGGTEVAAGEPVYLATEAAGATIYYKPYPDTLSVGYALYNPSTGITLPDLPCSILAYAENAGTTGREKLLTLTLLKVKTPTASRYSGALAAGQTVALSCTTPLATVYYTLTTNYGGAGQTVYPETAYSTPLSFTGGQFPVHIEARASRTGCTPSEPLILDYTLQATGGEKFYFGVLHSHTNFSDGTGTVEQAYAYARTARKTDFLAVTDHSNSLDTATNLASMDGAKLGPIYSGGFTKWEIGKAVAAAATDGAFVGMFGFEMTWSGQYGHITTLNTPGYVSRNDPQFLVGGGTGLQRYYDLLTEYPQSLNTFTHPSLPASDFDDFAYYTPERDAIMHMIEVGNGPGTPPLRAYGHYIRALDKGWHIAPANNQDNHAGQWGDANRSRTAVYTNDFTEQGIYAAIRDLRVIATEDEDASLLMKVNGQLFGTVFDSKPANLHFEVTVTNPNPARTTGTLSILSNNGRVVHSQSYVLSGGTATLTFDLPPTYDYYLARVDQSDGTIVITSPVWLGDVQKVSVSSVTKADGGTSLVVNEMAGIVITVDNEEGSAYVADSVTLYYLDDDGETPIVLGTAAGGTVPAGGQSTFTIPVTISTLGKRTFYVAVTGEIGGNPMEISGKQDFVICRAGDILRVAIDTGHDNYYVTGIYPNMTKRLGELVRGY